MVPSKRSPTLANNLRLLALPLILLISACTPRQEPPQTDYFSAASQHTLQRNHSLTQQLALEDQRDFEQARRGLIATPPSLIVESSDGRRIWSQDDYRFIRGESPDTVNPSLWRQAALNNIHGLFEVAPGIYQLRGFDLANMTLIQGETGWIVVDPLTSTETARAALDFAFKHLPRKPVTALIYTHSHIDHFGGTLGVTSGMSLDDNSLRVIAPQGFMAEATSENILAGIAMGRRASYMYGRHLERSPTGHIDTGLGKEPALGQFGLKQPTETVPREGLQTRIDGVQFEFFDVSGSEAPAELVFYLPQHKAFCGAEVVSRNLHNVYTLRGAKVRDALAWSRHIDRMKQHAGEAEVLFASHHWPVWDNAAIQSFLAGQRDTYKYIHDQTLRLANQGATAAEIAEQIRLPDALQSRFANRGYYGTVSHNVKAVYQHYFGWYDGNPANLNPLPPAESASRYVALMGGAETVIQRASEAFEAGEYRWAAEILNHVVFDQPDHEQARDLLAGVYEQLGFQAESGPWRDTYLSAAQELRHGVMAAVSPLQGATELLRQTPVPRFLDSLATRLNGPKAADRHLTIKLVIADRKERYLIEVANGVLHHRVTSESAPADATLRVSHDFFIRILTGSVGLGEALTSDEASVEGRILRLVEFLGLLDKPDGNFAIVTP
ncbi:alkyl/aryl-sulfatase [Biformimicrobium ophioploci]|uniref:Alkyl sulfatase dimerization domain-containing protein n=1 Tax=Biformimicrobium ophioploci TaxID=3036711 RepID=A0ABQ6M170_9GAMM|nr:alkyl sulfatase dimerization domain-containing protein [Microbulbifer sp. NKW57]GMG88071.1 alkyl sulfatase dimerization domain-containing protein [Microbulbifer sp. NKW57]